MLCVTIFFQQRDHYLEAKKYGHAIKCAWPLFFHVVNQLNSGKLVVTQLKNYGHTYHIFG